MLGFACIFLVDNKTPNINNKISYSLSIVDHVITENFASHFSRVFTCNNPHRMIELHDEYNRLRDQYYGLPLNDDINFDTELVSRVF